MKILKVFLLVFFISMPSVSGANGGLSLDCIGVIMEYVEDSSIIYNCRLASKDIDWYLTNRNPDCLKHIKFVCTKPPTTVLPFVQHIKLKFSKKTLEDLNKMLEKRGKKAIVLARIFSNLDSSNLGSLDLSPICWVDDKYLQHYYDFTSYKHSNHIRQWFDAKLCNLYSEMPNLKKLCLDPAMFISMILCHKDSSIKKFPDSLVTFEIKADPYGNDHDDYYLLCKINKDQVNLKVNLKEILDPLPAL